MLSCPDNIQKVETLSEEVFRRNAAGETNREIGARFGLSKEQIKGLVKRQNRKQRPIANGYVPQPKGRPRKGLLNIDRIIDCQQRCKQTYGCRRVRRWLKRQHGKNVNLKAVLRVMRKLDLLSQVRRRKPYRHYQQAVRICCSAPLPNRFLTA